MKSFIAVGLYFELQTLLKVFLFPFEDVHTRNHESVPINFRSSPVTIDDISHLAATLVQEVPANSGNFPWYMTDSIATVFLCKHEIWKCT